MLCRYAMTEEVRAGLLQKAPLKNTIIDSRTLQGQVPRRAGYDDGGRRRMELHLRATYPAARGMTTSPLIGRGHVTSLKGESPASRGMTTSS